MDRLAINIGGKLNGLKVKHLVYSNEDVIVAICENDSIQYDYDETKLDFDDVDIISQFQNLKVKTTYKLPEEIKAALSKELAGALACALISKSKEEALEQFSSVTRRINSAKDPEQAKAYLILDSLALLAVFSVVLICLYYNVSWKYKDSFLFITSGVLGAFSSLLIRSKKVHLSLVETNKYVFLQSLIITITGAISGGIVVVFIHADLAFGFAKNNFQVMLVISMAAGFSERMIPDLFKTYDYVEIDANREEIG